MYFCAPIRVCEQLRKNAEKIFFLCLKNRITLNSNKKPFLSYYTAHKYKGTRLAQFMNTSFQSKWQDKSIYQYYNQWHRKTFYFSTILAVAVTQNILYSVIFHLCIIHTMCPLSPCHTTYYTCKNDTRESIYRVMIGFL